MSRTLTGWSFWGTRGSRGTEAPARQPGTRVNPLQRAGPIRVRAEIPSVTRKRAFLNHAAMSHRLSERALEWEPAEDPTTFEADVSLTLNRIKVLEQVFSPLQVSGMVDVVRRGPFRWNDLAQATGISLRTFYSRLGEIRGAIPRSKPGFQSNKD